MDESKQFQQQATEWWNSVGWNTDTEGEKAVAIEAYVAGVEAQRQVGPCGHPVACWEEHTIETFNPEGTRGCCRWCASEQALKDEIAAREAELTTLRDKLRGLEEQWINQSRHSSVNARGRRACANDLAVLLAEEAGR